MADSMITKETIVTPVMIDDFERDGVICVRNLIDMALVERLRTAINVVLEWPDSIHLDSDQSEPSTSAKAKTRRFHSAHNGWRRNDAYRELTLESAVPRVAAELMKSKLVRLLYDHTLVKEPNSTVPIDWHHDLPFWPVSGKQICSVWVALDEVTKESGAVHYARGSHKSAQRYRPTVPDTPDFAGMMNLDLPLAPNLFEDPNADLLYWDMQPGDALVFSALTLHGSGANLRSDRSRRAISPRYLGDDARFVSGRHTTASLFEPDLKTGDVFDDPQFPIAWKAKN
jgi:ectoine hydroxylase-related dioxygenase (phytanoyl-CoA dioxygenase family)